MPDGDAMRLLLFVLVLWATAGLTLIHLAVLGVRWLVRRHRHSRTDGGHGALPGWEWTPPDLTLTYVVPVYNDALTVGATIDSILAQSVRPHRILVVNDGSTDGTAQVLESYRAKGVDVLHLPHNVGKSHALDAALKRVYTDLVAVTDADSIVHADYVKEMLNTFRDPKVAAAGGAVESIPHTWVTAARQIEYMVTVSVDRDAEVSMDSLVVLPGVSSTYRTAVLQEMGFEFDTIAEDFDLTFRMQRAGKKITMNLRAKVFTSDPPTLRSYHRQLLRWYTDFWLVLRKHRDVLGKRVFGTVEVPMLILNATASSALYLALPVWLLFTSPRDLLAFLGIGIVIDLILIVIAWRVYRRNDVWLAVASRIPTRFIARYTFLVAMWRVLCGRPGLAWQKLERRSTHGFLAGGGASTSRARP